MFNVETVIAGLFREKILPGAFADSVANDDVPAQFNHDPNYVLGRTGNETVRLEEDRTGLHYEVDLNEKDPDAQRVGAKVERGDVCGSSFMFVCEDDSDEEWVRDDPAKLPLRIIKRATLYDVAPVTSPAYSSTSVSARVAAALGVSPDIVRLELELLEMELQSLETSYSDASPAPRARRTYSAGAAGIDERERELVLLELE